MVAYIRALRDELGAIVISDYSKGVVTKPFWMESGRSYRIDLSLYVWIRRKNDFSLYQGFDIITPNHHEAGQAAGAELVDKDNLIQVGTALLDRYNFKAILITRGEEGMSLFEKKERSPMNCFRQKPEKSLM